MGKQRLVWADSLKGWLMVLVVLGHAIQCVMPDECFNNHVWNVIYSFHMPAFMAVSGWFAYRSSKPNWGGYWQALCRRFKQLVVPFLLWTLLSMIVSWNVSVGGFIKTILYPDTSFWFLWVLFWINVLFMSGRWVASMLSIDELLPNVAICLVLLGIMVGVEFRMLGFQFLAYYFVFYLFGYCLHRYSAFRLKSVWVGMALMAVWAILAWFWNMHQLPCWLQGVPYVPKALLQYAYRGATAMIAVFVILSYSERLLGGSGMMNMALRWVGTVSLGLYVCHLTIIGKLNDLLQRLCYLGCEANVIVLFLVTLFASIAIVGGLTKSKLASHLFLGKL